MHGWYEGVMMSSLDCGVVVESWWLLGDVDNERLLQTRHSLAHRDKILLLKPENCTKSFEDY